jgi:hypothetical protein
VALRRRWQAILVLSWGVILSIAGEFSPAHSPQALIAQVGGMILIAISFVLFELAAWRRM